MTLTAMWLKSIARYPIDWRRAETIYSGRVRVDAGSHVGRPIVLEMTTPQLQFDCGRHLNALVLHAQMIGSPFYLRCSRVLFAALVRKLYGRELLSGANLIWLQPDKPLPRGSLVFHDANIRHELYAEADEYTHFRLLIGRDAVAGTEVMPYPMHPHTLTLLSSVNLSELRQRTPRGGIFFAGRLKANYENVGGNFGVMTRLQIVESLRRRFPGDILERLNATVSDEQIVLLDASTSPLSTAEWLPTLAQHNFFVCCPGVCQPMCHNVIEAMSVGTIPIIEYGDRFSPKLMDGVNAIRFEGEAGLVAAISRIQRFSSEDLARIRSQTIAYYERYLRGDKFLARLREHQPGETPIAISMPFHDANFY